MQRRRPPAAGRGRQKGELNKLTRTLKEAILAAFDEVGGRDYLVAVAKDDPKTFCGLLARVLPLQVDAEMTAVRYEAVDLTRLTDEQLRTLSTIVERLEQPGDSA